MKNIFFYDTSIGKIAIKEEAGAIINIYVNQDVVIEDNMEVNEAYEIKEAISQIEKYIDGELKEFDLKLEPKGTSTMLRVWNELKKIPYGETRSYKEIAEAIGIPDSVRNIARLISKNPIPIVIPCHRVIGVNKKLIGFRLGLDLKAKLLDVEGSEYKIK